MANRLPFWYQQPRGAGLASLAVLEPDESQGDQGFLDRLEDYLFGWISDTDGLVTGVAAPLLALLVATAATAPQAPLAAAFLGLAALLWLGAAGWSWWLVASKGDAAPAWAAQVVKGLTGLGRGLLMFLVLATVAAVVLAVLALVIAAMSDRRS